MTLSSPTPLTDSDSLFNLLESVEHAVALSLTCEGRSVFTWRRIVGWSEPPNDCCPEIAVWGGNIRPDPTSMFEGMRATCTTAWLFDITIRVSECFVDVDENGKPLASEYINDYSRALYALMHDAFFGFWCRWTSGQIDELEACTPITILSTSEYAEGGCAGFQFTVTTRLG